jgi:hypothetical protein
MTDGKACLLFICINNLKNTIFFSYVTSQVGGEKYNLVEN